MLKTSVSSRNKVKFIKCVSSGLWYVFGSFSYRTSTFTTTTATAKKTHALEQKSIRSISVSRIVDYELWLKICTVYVHHFIVYFYPSSFPANSAVQCFRVFSSFSSIITSSVNPVALQCFQFLNAYYSCSSVYFHWLKMIFP